jgi:imidazolonepropionase-like amidohydrolase
VFLKKEKDIGTLAPGRYADIVAVRGDVLTTIELLQRPDVVVKNGVRVR